MSHGRPNCQYGEVRDRGAAKVLGGSFSRSYLGEHYIESFGQDLHQFWRNWKAWW